MYRQTYRQTETEDPSLKLSYILDRSGSGQGQVAGTCGCGDETSGSLKCGEFLDQLRTGQLLKKDSAVRSNQVSKYCVQNIVRVQENCVYIFFCGNRINQIYSFMLPAVDLFYCRYFLSFFPTLLSMPASTRSLSITASLPITIPLTRCSSRCVPREQPLLRTEYTARTATEGRRRVAMCCDTAHYFT